MKRNRQGKVMSCPILGFHSVNQLFVWGFEGDQLLVLRVRSMHLPCTHNRDWIPVNKQTKNEKNSIFVLLDCCRKLLTI